MFTCTKDPEKIRAMASILILGGVLPLAGAYLSQLLFDLHPCHFCLLQRYPYGVTIAAGIATLLLPRMGLRWRGAVAIGILATLASGILGLIHTGIEQQWLAYDGGCVAQAAADGSLAAMRAAIMGAPIVACNEISASFLGLSMATWNVLWALCVVLFIALQYRYEWRHYGRTH